MSPNIGEEKVLSEYKNVFLPHSPKTVFRPAFCSHCDSIPDAPFQPFPLSLYVI
jgi:hypothetical protein